MKTHVSLKELLLDYENEKDHMYNRPARLDPDDEMFIDHYVSNNKLVSESSEPLIENEGSQSKCIPFFHNAAIKHYGKCGKCGQATQI